MTFVRLHPVNGPTALQEEARQLFDSFFSDTAQAKDAASATFLPAADILEGNDAYAVTIDLPGVKKEDIKISVQENILTIRGEKNAGAAGGMRTLHTERAAGTFMRSFKLPARIQHGKIEAEYANGTLTLTLPKAEEARPREIEVTVR